jgi:hypothetical protein
LGADNAAGERERRHVRRSRVGVDGESMVAEASEVSGATWAARSTTACCPARSPTPRPRLRAAAPAAGSAAGRRRPRRRRRGAGICHVRAGSGGGPKVAR